MQEQKYYNRESKQITREEYKKILNGDNSNGNLRKYQQIAQNKTKCGRYYISTVWTGLPHFKGNGQLNIFETTVFNHKYEHLRGPFRHDTIGDIKEIHDALFEEYSK